jgi:SAM-dependent methyltransferase
MNETEQFYAELAPLYHLIYPDWDKGMERQAAMLDSVIREAWGEASTVLDVSCGIGTQAIGLAKLGYIVKGSDLSSEEVDRAIREAAGRGLSVSFSVADMRQCAEHHRSQFDVVIACDNSVPHLLSDEDILAAFRQMLECTRPGGGCIITVRDYETEDLSKQQIKPYGIRQEGPVRWLIWQVWDPRESIYDVTMYFVEDRGQPRCTTRVMRSKYYAIRIPRLMELMTEAAFADVRRLDGRFFQPMIIGTRKAQPLSSPRALARVTPRVLSSETRRRVDLLFRPSEREEATRLLAEQCGNNLPFLESLDAHGLERFQFAALKLSGGDLSRLRGAIALAQKDWRDLLMAAGFGQDARAHESWWPIAS